MAEHLEISARNADSFQSGQEYHLLTHSDSYHTYRSLNRHAAETPQPCSKTLGRRLLVQPLVYHHHSHLRQMPGAHTHASESHIRSRADLACELLLLYMLAPVPHQSLDRKSV